MKTVQLNDAGYTADGKWLLVLVEPTPEMIAEMALNPAHDARFNEDFARQYDAAIAACPAPDLPDVDVDIDAMQRELAELRAYSALPESFIKPALPPSWHITRVPDVEFQPRDQICISKIGADGKAERGGTACRLDDSNLFWHFFNDWLLMQEGNQAGEEEHF